MTTLTIHSKTDCPHCDTARAFLTSAGIPFTEVKHDDPADRAALYDRLGLVGPARTVPQCVVSDAGEDWLIGGARELVMSGVGSLFVGREAGETVTHETTYVVVQMAIYERAPHGILRFWGITK